jgi:hypothetical protein
MYALRRIKKTTLKMRQRRYLASNFNKNITNLSKKKPVFVYRKSGSRSKKELKN